MKLLVVLLAASVVQPKIPKTWNQTAITTLELPLANPRYSSIHVSEEMYYRIPDRVIYKNYPVYYPGREPAGYMEWL
ncbi:MAG TPA: hypothetical protein VKV15_06630, partial [Bryobacteraceae bacterium]|nr:hypothetical protein [Bryobacteraceae bacterium]